jgi:aminoglycoside/choline kinase family phosphotransferase
VVQDALVSEALEALFEKTWGERPAKTVALHPAGSGSARKLFRLSMGKRVVIGAVNADKRENKAFLGFSRHFRSEGMNVPEIYAVDEEAGVYLEEDLGDQTLFEKLTSERKGPHPSAKTVAVYEKVAEALPRFQIAAGRTLDYSLCYPRASFDKQSMVWDLNYFKYNFLRLAKIGFDEQALEDDFARFVELLLAAPRDFFLYRDFQSRNVMVRGGEPWFIDYQGGRKGALQYDLASLLYDAKADLPFALRDELFERYLKAAKKLAPLDEADFRARYPAFVFVRIMQAMGTYGLRGFYEGKSHFLASIPYAIRNIEHLLRRAPLPIEVPALTEVFRKLVASSALRQYGAASLTMTVRIQSFSYKNGMPADEKGHGGGFVFDCRSLPNPGRFERYKKTDGRDGDVIAFLKKERSVAKYLKGVEGLVDAAVSDYQKRNFTDLMVSFGCTGGQHRSVYCAERLAAHLREKFKKSGITVEVRHRERDK